MNRLFFRPEHAGMTKTDAAAQTLGARLPAAAPHRISIDDLNSSDF